MATLAATAVKKLNNRKPMPVLAQPAHHSVTLVPVRRYEVSVISLPQNLYPYSTKYGWCKAVALSLQELTAHELIGIRTRKRSVTMTNATGERIQECRVTDKKARALWWTDNNGQARTAVYATRKMELCLVARKACGFSSDKRLRAERTTISNIINRTNFFPYLLEDVAPFLNSFQHAIDFSCQVKSQRARE